MTGGDGWEPGDRVVDRDDDPDERDVAIVVNMPPVTADDWNVGDGKSVAEFPGNEAYPDDDPVVVVVFAGELEDHRPDYDGGGPIALSEFEADWFAFPASRLTEPEPPAHLQAIATTLRSQNLDGVEIDVENGVVRAEKLGETVTVDGAGNVREDGPIAQRIADTLPTTNRGGET